ncbi:MAG: MFS transporter, partial [Bdellovibrionota bacterium]
MTKSNKKQYMLAVLVAALGYFVDIYDLLLFSIVRVQSLKDLGFTTELELLEKGVFLINCQMAGLLIGGVLWGVLGDKKGRLSVLFGSIIMYSLANIANGFVNSIEAYAILRIIAGIGLAGELGAGITLVCELMPQKIRGYGTTIVAGIGLFGAVAASTIAGLVEWKTAYIIGGVMGLSLLLLRIGVSESGLFESVKITEVKRGSFFALFKKKESLKKYISVILAGVPIWFTIGILITFSPELGAAMGMTELPQAGKAVLFSYVGLAIGDLASGVLSQVLSS